MANVRIVYNRNLDMTPGKMAAQAVHAALNAYGISHGSVVVLSGSKTKVEQMDVQIHDAGLTEVEPGSLAAGASLEAVDGFDEYKPTMSCCRNATDHELHVRLRNARKLLEDFGYEVVRSR